MAVFALIGAALVWLYHDADQQDSGFHFLFARWAWQSPAYFVSVWGRPLFTLIYSIPAQFGYPPAKFFTVVICLATGWQTFRLAQQLKLSHPELAIPFLFLQPSFFLLSSAAYTEPLFALFFVLAWRLQIAGRINPALLVVSLLILIRPEGFFIGVLWGIQLILPGSPIRIPHSAIRILFLAFGAFLWWAAAYLITGDPLWIAHDWPRDWQVDGKFNGTGPIWWYLIQLPLIVGPLLLFPFFAGLFASFRNKPMIVGTASFCALFILHSLMYWRGWFGSAGYARYLVCVSPVISLITLMGWNRLLEQRRFVWLARRAAATAALAVSILFCLIYVDGQRPTRDARAIDAMREWFSKREQPVSRLITSQAYMRIVFDRPPCENLAFGFDRRLNLEMIRSLPPQTLVFWDQEVGVKWFQLRCEDFESAGFTKLHSREFNLEGRFFRLEREGFGGTRALRLHFFYKRKDDSPKP